MYPDIFLKMETLKLVLVVAGLVGLAVFGLALQIIFKKSHKFPEMHIGRNPEMKKKGISCATSFDKEEQAKARQKLSIDTLRLSDNI